MKKNAIKLVALLLMFCMLPIGLFACQAPNAVTPETDTETTTDTPTETQENAPTESQTETQTETQAPTETEPPTDAPTNIPTDIPTEPPTDAPTESVTETEPVTTPPTETNAPDLSEAGLVVFENGTYSINFVRSDTASDDDELLYEGIRSAFYDLTGKRPSLSTDYKLSDADKSAILIGNTDYQHSKDFKASLKKGEAAATFVDDKFVIAYTTHESMIQLMNSLTTKISKAQKDKVIIDSSWQIKIMVTPLSQNIALPDYNGTVLNSPIDLGQGSELYIINNTTSSKCSLYLSQLINAGFHLYTYNEIAGNEYYTLITNTQIVNLMYLKQTKEVRIIEDSRTSIELPKLPEENIYTATSKPSFTMMGISDAGYPGGMSFIYKLSDGTFFIIDGGMCANRTGSNECYGDPSVNRLFKTLQALADDKDKIVISGWLITHIHNDHAGAFIDLAEKSDYLKKITIKQVIYSQPADSDMTDSNQPKRLNWMSNALKKMGILKTVKAHPGQVFYFADLKLTILGSHDLVKPDKIARHNNASIVSMVEFGGKKMLFLADAEGAANGRLKTHYGNALDADILQVAHHGYNNTEANLVYPYITPKIVLWPIQTADWKSGDNVYNVSFNKTYLQKSGITHYCAGAANITFENLKTWVPTMKDWKP